MTGTPGFNTQIYEEAVEWFLRMRGGENDLAARTELTSWLRRSPEHVRAYLETASIWTEVRGIASTGVSDAEALIARALAESNVRELTPRTDHIRDEIDAPHRDDSGAFDSGIATLNGRSIGARRRAFLYAASVLVATATLSLLTWYQLGARTYSTETGEQRAITLADGSRVELNSQSTIRIRFSDDARIVDLREGQALFHVAKNPSRPFIVLSDEAQVRAVGTAFDVYRKEAGTLVTVVEGRVLVDRRFRGGDEPALRTGEPVDWVEGNGQGAPAIAPPSAGSTPSRRNGAAVELVAGEQVLVTARTLAEPTTVNVNSATAWTQRKLVFESASLTEVAREFNRYNSRPLVVRLARPDDFRISAVFPSTDPGSLIRFLREQSGISVEETDDAILISASADAER